MADSKYINFIGDVWNLLPLEDQERMVETWIGYEQVFASVYQKIVENDLNIALKDLQPYTTDRWLNYSFPLTDRLSTPAFYTSGQDLSSGVNLASRYLLRFRVDGENAFEVDLRGLNPLSTTINEIVSKINLAAGFNFSRTIFEGTIIQLVSQKATPLGSIEILIPSDPSKDASEFILGLEQDRLPLTFPKYPHLFKIPYDRVTGIPSLRDKIRDESSSSIELLEGIDYEVQTNNLIAFKNLPPTTLWAKRTLVDQETPWHNYGFLMDIYQKNTPNYVKVIQGLWYAFWTGPKPRNLQVALYLFFGLPVAQEDCTVTFVSEVLVQTTSPDGNIRDFEVPVDLVPVVSVGQIVSQYEPLVSGIEVIDKISKPGFIAEDIGRPGIQRFLLDEASRGSGDTDETKALRLLEEHTFLPQISVNAFVSADIDLGNVKTFLGTIKPLNKAFLFQIIVGEFYDKVSLQDAIGLNISIDVTPNLDSNQTTFSPQDLLHSYELEDNASLNLDSDGVSMQEGVEIEVYRASVLIDSFAL